MKQPSESAKLIGRSMEPSLFQGDLVELEETNSFQEGEIYVFKTHAKYLPTAHRLVKVENQILRFKGDRQPFEEFIPTPEKLHRVKKVLLREQAPRPEAIFYSLLSDLPHIQSKRIFPQNATQLWPWKDLLAFGQKHRLNAPFYYLLQKHGIPVPEEFALPFQNAFHEAMQRDSLLDCLLPKIKEVVPEGILLKGALLRDFYPETALRVMEDVDLWVPKEKYNAICLRLEQAGFYWSQESKKIAEFYPHTSFRCPETGISIDLHGELFQPDRFRLPVLTPKKFSPEEEFVYLSAQTVMHWGRHGQNLLDLYMLRENHFPNFIEAHRLAKLWGLERIFLFTTQVLEEAFNVHTLDLSGLSVSRSSLYALKLAQKCYGLGAKDALFSRKKHLLQLLLSDSFSDFYRLWKSPSRKKMKNLKSS